MSETLHFKNVRGEMLAATLHGTWGARVVIGCHGLLSTRESEKQRRLGALIAARGMAYLRFDFAGRGDSDGETEAITYSRQMHDLDAAIECAAQQGARRIGLFGWSMGGAVALLSAAREARIAAIATMGAVAYPAAIAERYPADVEQWRQRAFVEVGEARISWRFLEDAITHNVVSAARIVQGPVLVLHGTEDQSVSPADAHDLATAAPNASLEYVDGADHAFSNPVTLRQVVRRVAGFMDDCL